MRRSLFAQTAARALAFVVVLGLALLLKPSVWLAVGVGVPAALWLAWSVAGLVARDEPVLRGGVVALAEGHDVDVRPGLREHDRLAAAIAAASEEVRRDFATSSERREKLEALLDSMQDAVTSVDAVGRIIWANKAMQRLVVDSFGSVRAGHSLVQTIRAPEVLECMQAVLETRRVAESRPVALAPGHVFAVSAAPMPEGGAVVVLRDVTRMEQMERTQREFVANVSHELRTPLTSIQGYVEMLLDTQESPLTAGVEREFLEAILKSARRMGRLTDDLLALARVESGEQKLEPRAVRVATLMEEATAGTAGLLKEKEGALTVGPVPEIEVLADQDAVVQILSNLIANALSYGIPAAGAGVSAAGAGVSAAGAGVSAAGAGVTGARVELTAESSALLPHEVRFGVRDFGEGIASEHLPRLFERFYRVDKVRSRESGGTGLGLAIAKHLVESQHGRIWVESELGRGSVFYFTLPTVGAAPSAGETEASSLPLLF
jgi:two-component system phosphate regulon sensor histidine kinase PhoR